jgi:hypothetical protein
MKAKLRLHEKYQLSDRYIVELSLYEINDPKHYPEGFKYGLICIDSRTGRKILMDNHSPKGHHVHIDSLEYDYNFTSIRNLLMDFRKLAHEHLGVIL